MKNIPLNVLDAYANRLSDNQVNMLYESKVGKSYKKALYENLEDDSKYNLYLDKYTMASELDANKVEVIMHLNKKYGDLMEKLTYRIDSDSINFSTKDRHAYTKLTDALMEMGISDETIIQIRDKKI